VNQRYYSPGSGRFMTSDPYVASGGVSSPGSWNRYAYVDGDPVNWMDPRGLDKCNGNPSCVEIIEPASNVPLTPIPILNGDQGPPVDSPQDGGAYLHQLFCQNNPRHATCSWNLSRRPSGFFRDSPTRQDRVGVRDSLVLTIDGSISGCHMRNVTRKRLSGSGHIGSLNSMTFCGAVPRPSLTA
jgi:hypothetical protein